MGKVIAQASMSLDGFIADTNDEVDALFDWYQNGDGEVTGSHPEFRTSAASAAYLRQAWSTIGVDVIGRQVPCGGERPETRHRAGPLQRVDVRQQPKRRPPMPPHADSAPNPRRRPDDGT
jgi:hypothetical protein